MEFIESKRIFKRKGHKLLINCFGKTFGIKLCPFSGAIFRFFFGSYVEFYWQDLFNAYFKENNMYKKVDELKEGMDSVSIEYINKFVSLIPYWHTFRRDAWTNYDKKTKKVCKKLRKSFKQPFPEILTVPSYYYSNIYGLIDLRKDVFKGIDGKIIVDGGAMNGDTALMFHYYFRESTINCFEPLTENLDKMNQFLQKDRCDGKIVPIPFGLSREEETKEIDFDGKKQTTRLVSIDKFYQNLPPVGLIKLDEEGSKTEILEGAIETIKRDKPVIVAAMYHTPEDFFDLKQKIKDLNLGYKFMIRRSQMEFPQVNLVLIAYV